MAQTVTHTSPAKIKSALIGNKKRALEVEHATTPTPQSYTSGDRDTAGPQSKNPHTQWDEDINSSGEEDIGEDDQYSMKTNYTDNLADRLMNKDEKISNLFSSLLEAVNFVLALENGGDIKDARENQHITGCMTGLANALLRQPYRVIMEQQSGLLQSMMEINRTVTALVEKVTNNGEKIDHLQEATYNATAVLEKLQAIN